MISMDYVKVLADVDEAKNIENFTLLRWTYFSLIGATGMFQILSVILIVQVYRYLKFSDIPQLLSIVSIFLSLSCK
jgi:hypothetical protein